MLQGHNNAVSASPSEGERIALRRKRLGWKQQVLADKAGVGITTVVQIEKDRNVQSDRLRAVLNALDAAEKKNRPVTGSVIAPGTNGASMKEGADALADDEDLAQRLANLEALYATGLADLRLIRLAIDTRVARRKSS
jgi:transcriptional regulator with XRE-family HTH domain